MKFLFSNRINDFNLSYLAQCDSHTMHRFSKQLKKKKFFNVKLQKEQFTFSLFCFSLLLNTVDIESTKIIFKHMCFLFLSKSESPQCARSYNLLDEFMQDRPQDQFEIKAIIRKTIFVENQTNQSDNDATSPKEIIDGKNSSYLFAII